MLELSTVSVFVFVVRGPCTKQMSVGMRATADENLVDLLHGVWVAILATRCFGRI
jgi:hypothetical protein